MSSTKHITQGGQVFGYMLGMFMQVNKRISFYLILFYLILTPVIFYLKVPLQEIKNGGLYWWLYFMSPGEKALYRVPPVYDFNFDGTVYHFTSANILKDPYMTYAGDIFLQELWLSLFWSSVLVLLLAFMVYTLLHRLGEKQARDETTGGRELTEDVSAVARQMQRRREASPIRIDKLPLILNSEVKNMLMHGTPGSGKSNTINKLLLQLRERGDMVIIFDKGCSLVKKHFHENRDKLLNPLDARCENWDLWRECLTTPDFDSMSNTLIPQGTKEDPFWTGSARTIFTAVAAKLRNDPERSYNKLLRTLLAIDLKALREYVAGTEASNLMEEKVEKTAISIRGVLTNYVKALRYLQGIERNGKAPFAIREWMKQANEPKKPHGWLWITSNARQHESLKPLISMWLAQAANCVLEMNENPERRIWFIYDELASLHKLPELPQVLSEARKFGGCFVMGFQNKPQLDFTYGEDYADAMMDLLNTRFFFRSPDQNVAMWVRDQLGQKRAKLFNEQYSYGADTVRDGVSFSKQEDDKTLVSYSDIQKLPDLECYVTLPGDYPVVRMKMTYEKIRPVAAEFIERALNDSLEQDITDRLDAGEQDDARLQRLLDGSGTPAPETPSRLPPQTAAVLVVPPVLTSAAAHPAPVVSAAVPSVTTPAAAVTAENTAQTAQTDTAVTGGREQDVPDMVIDTATGEIVYPGADEPDAETRAAMYENYSALHQEEKNIAVHRRAEPDDHDEPGWGEW